MNIKLLTDNALQRKQFQTADFLICIASSTETIPTAAEQASQVMLLEFENVIPVEPTSEYVDLASLEDIKKTLELLDRTTITNLYVYSSGTPARALSVVIGLLAAVNHGIKTRIANCNDALYEAVKQCVDYLPNEWVVALYDYQLQLEGRLSTVVADYTVTGIVINSVGRTIETTSALS